MPQAANVFTNDRPFVIIRIERWFTGHLLKPIQAPIRPPIKHDIKTINQLTSISMSFAQHVLDALGARLAALPAQDASASVGLVEFLPTDCGTPP